MERRGREKKNRLETDRQTDSHRSTGVLSSPAYSKKKSFSSGPLKHTQHVLLVTRGHLTAGVDTHAQMYIWIFTHPHGDTCVHRLEETRSSTYTCTPTRPLVVMYIRVRIHVSLFGRRHVCLVARTHLTCTRQCRLHVSRQYTGSHDSRHGGYGSVASREDESNT